MDEIGVKSNSKTVAFVETIAIPDAAKVASNVVSPVHDAVPSLNIELFGPCALWASPVDIITPLCIGKFGLVF